MDILIDASCIVAVLLDEEKGPVVEEKTKGASLIAPACLPYEIGNALSAMVKRNRLDSGQAAAIYGEFEKFPIRLIEPDMKKAVRIAAEEKHYAYDAYYIACALDKGLPLYTVDNPLLEIAKKRGVKCL